MAWFVRRAHVALLPCGGRIGVVVVVYVPLLLRWLRRELGALRVKSDDAAAELLADPATGAPSTETLQITQRAKAAAHAALRQDPSASTSP